MGQLIQVEANPMGHVALFTTDRSLTGQDGVTMSPGNTEGEDPPHHLARRLFDADGEIERYLIVEVSGTRKDQDKREAKAEAAEHRWCAAVNNHGGFGRWGYVEISNMKHAESAINEAINRLHMNVLEAALAD